MKKIIIILALFFIGLTIHAQTTYYIDPAGSDASGNGTIENPWKSLYKACTTIRTSGNIIHVNAGTYTETSQCNLAVGVSIEGEGNTSIIISHVTGSVNSFNFTILLSSSSTTNGNQHISNIKMDGDTTKAYGAIYVVKRSNVEIYNCTIVDFFFYGVGFQGGNRVTDDGLYVIPPVTYPTDNKIHDCIITNSSAYYPANEKVNGEGKGAIIVDGQEKMLIYNNLLTQTSRASGSNGYLIKGVFGLNKGLKIYNNTITKAPYDGTTWDFAIELWLCRGGVEIYNNNITGSVDISGSGGELTASTQKTGSYTYGVWIHNNYIHQVNSNVYEGIRGILIEQSAEDVILERNHIKNVTTGIYCPLGYAGNTFKNINISYNILENIGGPDWQAWGIQIENPTRYTCDNVNIDNNVIIARNVGLTTTYGITLPVIGTTTNINIRNNIIQGFNQAAIYAHGVAGETLSFLSIKNNIFYNNGNSNLPRYEGITPTYVFGISPQTNRIGTDPRFVSSSNFHLKSGSPAINAGINVGSTSDFEGKTVENPPEIGAYEFISNDPPSIQDQGFQINENSPSGTAVGTVVASDPDAGQTLSYSIVSGNTNGAFSIDALSGVLSVSNGTALNVDFALVIKVQDNGVGELTSQATIAINIVFTEIEITGNNETIKVYPNPVSDKLIIEIEENNDRQGFEILNSIGQIVFKGKLSEKTVLETTSFSPGVYIMKLENRRSLEFKKIVKV